MVLQIRRPHRIVWMELGGWVEAIFPVGPRRAEAIDPSNRRLGSERTVHHAGVGESVHHSVRADVVEDARGVIEDDVEHDEHVAGVSFINQRAKFLFGSRTLPVGCEALVDVHEVLLSVAVIAEAAIGPGVLQDRGEPDRFHAKLLQVRKLSPDAFEGATLAEVETTIPCTARGATGLLNRSIIRK